MVGTKKIEIFVVCACIWHA